MSGLTRVTKPNGEVLYYIRENANGRKEIMTSRMEPCGYYEPTNNFTVDRHMQPIARGDCPGLAYDAFMREKGNK